MSTREERRLCKRRGHIAVNLPDPKIKWGIIKVCWRCEEKLDVSS